jgi:hypothetical protein
MPPFPSVLLLSILYKYVCVTGLGNTSKYMSVFILSSFGIIIIILIFLLVGTKETGAQILDGC